MKKIFLLIFALVFSFQTIKAQVALDTNGITVKWNGTTVPTSYFVQASPRGTLEWFAIVSDSTKSNISDYVQNVASGITYFTPPGGSSPIPFNNILTSRITNMSYMFADANAFNQPIGSWDVSAVTDMRYMFTLANSFNQPLGSWNVSKVTSMNFMFYNANAFNQNIGSWNVSNVTEMNNMFSGFAGLSTANYDTLLTGWSTIILPETPLKTGVSFSAGNSKYCNGVSARSILINSYGWTITDGGLDCSTLGLEEYETSKLKFYPNPTNNIINIEGLNKNENNTIQIFDVQGKLVITKTINEKGTIDLSELKNGIYVIKIGELAQRIVKM